MISSIQTSPFCWPVRIYYEDTDAGGIVYHANYLKYFDRARTEWLRHSGYDQQKVVEQHQTIFVMKSAFVDYHLPARLDDELTITTGIEKFGQASMVFVQKAWRGEQCLVDGRFKLGCVDIHTMRPCAIPSMDALQLKPNHVVSEHLI